MITIQLLGGACLRSGEAPIAGPPAQRHRIALLALIAASWPQPLSRDRAMALLWPERDESSARRLLNLAVHVLRVALDENAIVSTCDGLVLNPASVRCDLHQLRGAIAANSPEDIVRLYAGPLLDGFHLSESADFGYWLDERRNEFTHAYVGALRALVERQEQSGDAHACVGTSRRLVAADPYSGANARVLMRALDAAGDRAGAIQHASEYAQRLRADLELQPDPEVIALANEIRATPVALELSTPNAVGSRGRMSIAVLPFANLSAHPDNEYFADGLTEDVIAELSKIRALRVTSGAPASRERRERKPNETGQALGATLVLDGSVRRSADHVRIVAKLIDVESEQHVWAETYDRRLTDIFSIQTDVALRIASALEAELRPSSRGSTSSNVGSGFVRRTRHSLGALRDAVRTRGTSATRS